MQSTQSSGTVLFRAVVMVGFLAVIFYAAVSGNALPDAARKQIEKFLPRALLANKSPGSENANPSSAASAAGEAPLFNSAPTLNTSLSGDAAPRKLAQDGSASLLPVPPAAGALPLQANNNSPTTGVLPLQGNKNSSPVVPVNYQTPAEVPAAAATTFAQIQDRLKQLGATYYLLETWGNQQQLYRFYCKMAVGGNSNYTHCFEYISADPQQAMAEVLKQVEGWRNGGSAVR